MYAPLFAMLTAARCSLTFLWSLTHLLILTALPRPRSRGRPRSEPPRHEHTARCPAWRSNVGEDAQQHRRHHREPDGPAPGVVHLLEVDQPEHDRGEPARPEQPMNSTVARFSPVPRSASATGTMRTTVRLSSA